MKKVRLVAVGRLKESYFKAAAAEYEKRLSFFGRLTTLEIEEGVSSSAVRTESAAILNKLSGYVVLLDSRGALLTSPELSEKMESAYQTNPEITFIIGGSEGVSDDVRSRADLIVSFGRITYPHRLMRVVLLEQIYRAFSIAAGLPYHK